MKKQSSKWGAVCSLALVFQLVVPPVATVASEVEEAVIPATSEAVDVSAGAPDEGQRVEGVPPAVESTPALPEVEDEVEPVPSEPAVVLPEEETPSVDEPEREDLPSVEAPEAETPDDDSTLEEEEVVEEEVVDQAAADAAVWGMDGRIVKAYKTGEVEYEFAFRHAPQEGYEAVDLAEATFYLDLPAGVQYEGATFGGRYDEANHRVIWVNPGGIPTSHANFDPSTPRRVNVQLKYTNTEHLVKVKAYASYTPKGSTQRFTNHFQLEHGFEGERPQLSEGVTIKGSLAERPGLPSTFPVLAGERFTYDVEYSLYSPKNPFKNAQLFVQLTDKMKFDKHVQLTGDFSTYRYDAEHHRFIFDFKPEIHEANGLMKINNLYFPNYQTAAGTDSVIQMTLHYGDSKVVGIEPDTLTAFAVADWEVSKRKVAPAQAPRVGEEVTYEIVATDTNPREYGMLSIDQAELVEKLPKEAKFVNAYELSPDGIEMPASYDSVNHQVVFHPTIADGDKEKTFHVIVQYENVPERGVVFLNSHYLYKPFEAELEERAARLVHKVVESKPTPEPGPAPEQPVPEPEPEKPTPGPAPEKPLPEPEPEPEQPEEPESSEEPGGTSPEAPTETPGGGDEDGGEDKDPIVPVFGTIEVTVVDAKDESKTLSGAVIELFDEKGTAVKRVTTDEAGVAAWGELAEGTYSLKIVRAASGYRLDRTVYELDVIAGEVSSLTLQHKKRQPGGGGGGTGGMTEEPELPVAPETPGGGEGNETGPDQPTLPVDPEEPAEGEETPGLPEEPGDAGGEEPTAPEGSESPGDGEDGEGTPTSPNEPSTPPQAGGTETTPTPGGSSSTPNGTGGTVTTPGGNEQVKTKPSTNGTQQLPQTGEEWLTVSLWGGLALLGAGWLLFRRSTRKASK